MSVFATLIAGLYAGVELSGDELRWVNLILTYHERKWRAGWGSKGQLNWREQLRNLPDHRVSIDGQGVYNERKRLVSKYYGVRWRQSRDKHGEWQRGCWHVSFWFKREYYYGGEFKEELELTAAKAYDDLVRRVGADKPLNFPSDR